MTRHIVRSVCVAVFCAAAAPGAGIAQVADPTATEPPVAEPTLDWAASWSASAGTGVRGTLELSGVVQDGWHVYALTQRRGGPTALRVSLDDNPVASLAGTPSGTPPERRQDPSFGLETQFYTRSFAVHVPVVLKSGVEGGQVIPVSVRFQMCSARECRPPKTVHLSVPIEVHPGV